MMRGAIEGQTQVVFVRLDPFLQTLLSLVSKYQQLMPTENNDQDLFQVIQILTLNVDQLQQAILQFGHPFAPSLIVLADYISLPLNAILHIQDTNDDTAEHRSMTGNKEISRRRQVRTSHIRKLHQSTAKAIQAYVNTCCGNVPNSRNDGSVSLNQAHLIKFLVALTTVLPDSPPSSPSVGSQALDDGTEIWLIILAAIDEILGVCSADEIVKMWDGNLVARIADCTSSLALSKTHELSLQSLKTLYILMKTTSPNKKLWQGIFPGVFAALYRRFSTTNRQTPSKLSVSIETKSLEILQILLKVTLSETRIMQPKAQRSAIDLLQQLAISSNNTNRAKGTTHSPPPSDSSSSFLSEVQKRVVTPLSLLLRQGVTSSSPKVKIQIASLCQILLVGDAAECWKSTDLQEVALETCLVLRMSDSEEEIGDVAIHARKILRQVNDGEDNSWMISRIQALVEETAVLAQGSRMIELQTKLQLLIGYIDSVGSDGSAALAASAGMLQSLVSLADINFDSAMSKGPAIEVNDGKQQEGSLLLFRRVHGPINSLVRQLLRTLGKALGLKHGSIVIDACISDFYEACLQQSNKAFFQVEFLHQWIGSLVISREILNGAFSWTVQEDMNSKQQRRRQRLLESLSSSVLPLLVDSFLWNLRTVSAVQQVPSSSGPGNKGRRAILDAPASLSGNISVTVLLLELKSTFFELMGKDIGSAIVSSMLYPIVQKASQENSALVQRAARRTAIVLAKACSCSSLEIFLLQEFRPLLGTMFGRLRLPGGGLVPKDANLYETLSVLASTTWFLQQVAKASRTEASLCGVEPRVALASLIDLISLLEDRFDNFSLRKKLSEPSTHDIITAHQVCFDYINSVFRVDDNSIYSYPTATPGSGFQKPWLDILARFKSSSLSGSQVSFPEGGIKRAEEATRSLIIGKGEISFVAKLIAKDCYNLSKPSLKVQAAACTSLTSGYRFLGFVSCNYEDTEDEQNTIKNSILQQAASSWPSIKARVHNVFEEVVGSKIVNITLIVRAQTLSPEKSTQNIGAKRFFLAKLFTLIATMCECGGEFMISRFKSDIWPVTARFLGRILEKEQPKEPKKTISFPMIYDEDGLTETKPSTSNISDSEQHLICTIFDCFCRAFHILAVPENVLASVGTTLLPFLDSSCYQIEIASGAMKVLQKITERNCDVLYRPLLELSGRGILPCQLQIKRNDGEHLLSVQSVRHRGESVLATKASELLEYIDSLPEQIIY